MKTEEVLMLIKAGYTKEDIAKMEVEQAPTSEPVETTKQVKEEPEKPKSELQLLAEQVADLTKLVMERSKEPEIKEEASGTSEDVAKKEPETNAVIEEIRKMREAMQASNIMNSQQEEPMTTEKALASIIS